MAATPSIRLTKSCTFEGGIKLWSNRYHFTGGMPASTTAWDTLTSVIVGAEILALPAQSTIVAVEGFAAGTDLPVYSTTLNSQGTLVWATGFQEQALEVAAVVRWQTAARSVKNHPIYLFSYIHNVAVGSGGGQREQLDLNQKAALEVYAGKWQTGFSDGTHVLQRSSPNGATATGHTVHQFVSHRDFP